MIICRSMPIHKKTAFSRRLPDLVTEELAAVLSSKSSYEFKELFDIVHENLKNPLRKISRNAPVVSLPCHGITAHRSVKSRRQASRRLASPPRAIESLPHYDGPHLRTSAAIRSEGAYARSDVLERRVIIRVLLEVWSWASCLVTAVRIGASVSSRDSPRQIGRLNAT